MNSMYLWTRAAFVVLAVGLPARAVDNLGTDENSGATARLNSTGGLTDPRLQLPHDWMLKLADDEFLTRNSMALRIRTILRRSFARSASFDRLLDELRRGATADDLEVRLRVARLIPRILDERNEFGLRCALNGRETISIDWLPGYRCFTRLSGGSARAKLWYAHMLLGREPLLLALPPRAEFLVSDCLPLQIRPDDHNGWLSLLIYDLSLDPYDSSRIHNDERSFRSATQATSKLVPGSLRSMIVRCLMRPELGPDLMDECINDACPCRGQLRRCVIQWCEIREAELSDRQRFSIWRRLDLDDRCKQLAKMILDRSHPCPITTALAVAVAFECGEIEGTAPFAHDRRKLLKKPVAEPLRMTVPRVCDVWLALTLRRSGQDPRSIGMRDLRADPLWVYDPFSLGFRDPKDRAEAHRRQLPAPPLVDLAR